MFLAQHICVWSISIRTARTVGQITWKHGASEAAQSSSLKSPTAAQATTGIGTNICITTIGSPHTYTRHPRSCQVYLGASCQKVFGALQLAESFLTVHLIHRVASIRAQSSRSNSNVCQFEISYSHVILGKHWRTLVEVSRSALLAPISRLPSAETGWISIRSLWS